MDVQVEAVVNLVVALFEVHQHPLEVVDPLFVSRSLGLVIVNVKGNNLAVFFLGRVGGINRDRAVFPRAVNAIRSDTNGTRKDVAAIIVSMFADDVNPAGGEENVLVLNIF